MVITEHIKKKYLPTIGIECHVQLKTNTKLFAAVGNDARAAGPNTLISHICVGMPGALPYLNKAAVELAVRAAFALNTKPQKFSKFDRKHYFYPDLPKGYQITQYEQPIILGGHVDIEVDGKPKKVGVTRVHLEEDAGKTSHPQGADYSLVDLNRAGTPLLEVVSEPDMNSPAEAKAFAREVYLLMKYAGISDCDMYHGNLRFDVNVSVSADKTKKGIRSEVKNLNSFRSVENAVAYEIERQVELLEKGQSIIQETRGWDEAKQKTISQRGKEEAEDYRYMPEPDVPPLELDDEYVDKIKAELPELPSSIRQKLSKFNIDKEVIETILDSSNIYGRILDATNYNHVPGILRRMIFDSLENVNTLKINIKDHIQIAEMVASGKLSSSSGGEVLKDLLEGTSIEEAIKSHGQISDESEIEKIVEEVLSENQKAAEDVRAGETKAVDFLVGQVMAKSKGKANPSLAQKIISQKLNL